MKSSRVFNRTRQRVRRAGRFFAAENSISSAKQEKDGLWRGACLPVRHAVNIFLQAEALRPVRTERPDCPKTIGRLERGEILSSFQSYTTARAAGRTFFCSGKSHFQRKAGKRWPLAGACLPVRHAVKIFCRLRRAALFGRSASIMLFCAIRNAQTCRTASSGRRAGSPPPSRSPSRRPDRQSNARRPSARHRAAWPAAARPS